MKNRFLQFIITICGFCAITLSQASSRERTDFKVNTDGGTAEQNAPRVAVASDGSFVITWVDWREGTSDVYVQKFDTAGLPVGANQKINDESPASYQFEPSITMDRNNAVSLIWKDYRNNEYPSGADVFLQSFTSSFNKSGANHNLSVETPDSSHESPDIAFGQWGTAMVTWADYRDLNWDIYGQIVMPNGTLVGGNFRINDDQGVMSQSAPRVAASRSGWYVVVWTDQRFSNYDIYAQRFDSTGQKLGGNIKINTDNGTFRQAFADVATDGAGHFTVVWVDWRNGTYPTNPDIYLSKLDTNMVSLTGNIRLNTDVSTRAQREPAISADRLGNIAIVWSDSTASSEESWEISGQMIDVDGETQEANFHANTFSDSAQLRPDVALDGRYRYVTWVDKRNGNFDIYAAVHQYHNPGLIAHPSTMTFMMDKGGALPPSQGATIQHTGYNRLDFSATPNVNWLAVTPSSGRSPDSFVVSVITSNLEYGEHTGTIQITDIANPENSAAISIRLRVTPPELTVSSDTIQFTRIPLSSDSQTIDVTILNSGAGTLSWQAEETVDWLSLSSVTGNAPATLHVSATAELLPVGEYTAHIILTSSGATNSPDTIVCVMRVDAAYPVPALTSNYLYLKTAQPSLVDTSLSIVNNGLGVLYWTALVQSSWLSVTPTSGTDSSAIQISLTNFPTLPGLYIDTITITDTLFQTNTKTAVLVNLYENSNDTVRIEDVSVTAGDTGRTPVSVTLTQSVSRVRLFAQYDSRYLKPESFVLSSENPVAVTNSFQVDSIAHTISLIIQSTNIDSLIPAGNWELGTISITAKQEVGSTTLAAVDIDTLYTDLLTADGRRVAPAFRSGTMTIDRTTPVKEDESPLLPTTVSLEQNYPNPFNLTTVIPFSVPVRGRYRLEIFNILGSSVTTLLDEQLSAGEYAITWNGLLTSGRTAPSGIYFYRLKSESGTHVRKMVLLK